MPRSARTPPHERTSAEMLREAARELRLAHDGKSLGAVTLSLGGAAIICCRVEHAALYEAKNSGRNRVVVNNVKTLKVVESPPRLDQGGH